MSMDCHLLVQEQGLALLQESICSDIISTLIQHIGFQNENKQ